jgi:hypothetical protein
MMKYSLVKFLSLALMASFSVAPLAQAAVSTATYTPQTQQELLAYLYGILAQLQAQATTQNSSTDSRSSTGTVRNTPNPYFVNVTTLAPTALGRSMVTVRGDVDKGGSEYIDVWVQYGTGDSLTRTKTVPQITKTGRQAVSVVLDDLRSDTTYSYRFVAEDERGYRHYGQTRTFTTISPAAVQTFSGRPLAETEGTIDIKASGATVQAFISMNDYVSGLAFFVYGTNRSVLEDITEEEDYDSFKEIIVDSKVTYKRSLTTKATGRNTAKLSLSSLKPATKYFYRACVEYYDSEDIKRPNIRCGEVETFTTLN